MDDVDAIARAVATNRRLLGLPPQEVQEHDQVRAAFMAGYLAAGCAYCTPNEGREPAAEQAYERWREDLDG